MESISFALEPDLAVDEFVEILNRSTLGERRPVSQRNRLQQMLENSDVIVTARDESGELIGLARTITDYGYCAYLSDLAVNVQHQRQGIGKELIRQTQLACGPDVKLILLSAPAAENYYPRIGFTKHQSCWYKEFDPA